MSRAPHISSSLGTEVTGDSPDCCSVRWARTAFAMPNAQSSSREKKASVAVPLGTGSASGYRRRNDPRNGRFTLQQGAIKEVDPPEVAIDPSENEGLHRDTAPPRRASARIRNRRTEHADARTASVFSVERRRTRMNGSARPFASLSARSTVRGCFPHLMRGNGRKKESESAWRL